MRRITLALTIAITAFIGFVFYTTPDKPPLSKIIIKSPPKVPTPFDEVLLEYQSYIEQSLAESGTPGAAVAIVSDSSIVFLKGFGIRSVEGNEPVDAHTVFRLGSVSKPVSSSLAGILASDELFHWDDPVIDYLDTFKLNSPTYSRQLSVRNVLSHATGLPYHTFTNLIEEGHPLPVMLDELEKVDLIGTPGKIYSYQNVAYSIIDPVIAVASHHTFEEEIKSRLFGPLFMTDASVTYDAMLKSSNRAEPHLFRGRQWRTIPLSDTYYNAAPAGGVNASITDMAKWMVAMLGYRPEVISKSTITELLQPQVKATAKNRNFNRWSRIQKSYYGLGWRIINFKNDTLAYHGGYVNGYRSEIALHPTRKIAICVLANGPSSFSDYAIPSFFIIYDKYMRPQENHEKSTAP